MRCSDVQQMCVYLRATGGVPTHPCTQISHVGHRWPLSPVWPLSACPCRFNEAFINFYIKLTRTDQTVQTPTSVPTVHAVTAVGGSNALQLSFYTGLAKRCKVARSTPRRYGTRKDSSRWDTRQLCGFFFNKVAKLSIISVIQRCTEWYNAVRCRWSRGE